MTLNVWLLARAIAVAVSLGWTTTASAAILERISPTPFTYVFGTDFRLATPSVTGDVTAILQAVDLVLPPGPTPGTSTSGCEAADFAGFVPGHIALMQRGTCEFDVKVANAEAAGAVAALIFNEGQPGRTDAISVACTPLCDLPTLFASFAVGNELASFTGPVTIHLAVLASDVPEPGTLAVCLVGLVGMAMSGRRVRRACTASRQMAARLL